MKPDYAAIEARLVAATPGKWWVPGWVRNSGRQLDTDVAHVRGISIEAPPYTSVSTRDADASFIAAAPTDIRALLTRARALEALLGEYVEFGPASGNDCDDCAHCGALYERNPFAHEQRCLYRRAAELKIALDAAPVVEVAP